MLLALTAAFGISVAGAIAGAPPLSPGVALRHSVSAEPIASSQADRQDG